jgi:hypothetical protein
MIAPYISTVFPASAARSASRGPATSSEGCSRKRTPYAVYAIVQEILGSRV